MEPHELGEIWHSDFQIFLTDGANKNATFARHVNMMEQLDGVLTIALAERLGGPGGYNLLLGAVKSSLIYSFISGAVSYGHYSMNTLESGHFIEG